MLKLGRVTKVKVLFIVLVFVFNFDLFKFSPAILEKGLILERTWRGTDSPEALAFHLSEYASQIPQDI